jgi:hypothetical protein
LCARDKHTTHTRIVRIRSNTRTHAHTHTRTHTHTQTHLHADTHANMRTPIGPPRILDVCIDITIHHSLLGRCVSGERFAETVSHHDYYFFFLRFQKPNFVRIIYDLVIVNEI